jgi:transcription initiation factor TFIIH subunit 3
LDQRDVLQQLLEFFLPSTAARALLNAPYQKVVEFKASCFCHKKPVEFAYMCSVCLALTCSKSPVCDTCGTEAAHV